MPAAKAIQAHITPHRNHKLDNGLHLLTAFTIFMKGITKLEHAHEYLGFLVLCFTSAAAIVGIVLFHHWLSHRIRHLNVTTYLIECVVVGSVAYLQFQQGSLQAWFFLAAAIMFLAACFINVWAKGKTSAVFSEQGVRLWLNPLRHPAYAWSDIKHITLRHHELHLTPVHGKRIRARVAADAPLADIQRLLQNMHPQPAQPHE